ncbi:MAG: hypothetical protein DMF26_13050 [Verrucomicrobia bacterium]|nr:MAG: hypothetical protein DMF26_13050 [Verrucomicrobiota bacterium]
MGEPFSARPGPTWNLPHWRTPLVYFCSRAAAAFRPPRAFGNGRRSLCQHCGLPDARFDLDVGLLARRPIDARGAFSFNTNAGPRSINGFDGFYFSFITLSTVGYGDITPVSRIARWLAAMEAMIGLLYVAVLIARLVSLYSTPKSPDS